jgi:GNAT superfamily N-acetyltransferase
MMNPEQAALPSLTVELDDGSIAEIRPVRTIDRGLFEEGLARMSRQSREARFGAEVDHLTSSELDYLTDVDLVDHVAWGATIEGLPAGAGRYIRPDGHDGAEVAIAVVDEFQRRGLGRAIFRALVASARVNGVERLYFSIQPENRTVLKILDGVDTRLNTEQGMIVGEIEVADIEIAPSEEGYAALLRRYQSA